MLVAKCTLERGILLSTGSCICKTMVSSNVVIVTLKPQTFLLFKNTEKIIGTSHALCSASFADYTWNALIISGNTLRAFTKVKDLSNVRSVKRHLLPSITWKLTSRPLMTRMANVFDVMCVAKGFSAGLIFLFTWQCIQVKSLSSVHFAHPRLLANITSLSISDCIQVRDPTNVATAQQLLLATPVWHSTGKLIMVYSLLLTRRRGSDRVSLYL